jgi:hypothetical protein
MLLHRHAPALADDLLAGLRALSSSSAGRSSKRPRPAPAPRAPTAARDDAIATIPSQQTQPAPAGQQWTEVVHPQTGPHARMADVGGLDSSVGRRPAAGGLAQAWCSFTSTVARASGVFTGKPPLPPACRASVLLESTNRRNHGTGGAQAGARGPAAAVPSASGGGPGAGGTGAGAAGSHGSGRGTGICAVCPPFLML